MGEIPEKKGPPGGGRFRTTRWSLVLAATRADPAARAQALADLCATYWPPVYAFIRSRGIEPDTARDLTQGFFTQLIDKSFLERVDPSRGRFRTFLIVCVRHFMANARDRERALKRGGGGPVLSLDVEDPESRLRIQPADTRTPESIFEREWALATLRKAERILEERMATSGRGDRFRLLMPYVIGETTGIPYADIAKRIGTSDGAVRVAIHDLRRKYAAVLRELVADTVGDTRAVDDEIRYLLRVLGD